MSFLIFDIETIADPALWTAPVADVTLPALTAETDTTQHLDIVPPKKTRTRAKKAPALPKPPKDVFPPLYACRPIAIGFMQLSDNGVLEQAGVVGTLEFGDNEPALLTGWAEFVRQRHPTLVSFAGRGFDMPVLAMRAMHHGVTFSWHGRYQNRYKDEHLDLQDRLTEFGTVARTGYNLSAFSTMIGLPGKTGVDGSKVADLFAAGEHQKIADYCLEDVFRTALLFLRYQLMRGCLDGTEYRAAVATLIENAMARGPALGGLLWGLDKKRLLLE